MNSTQKHASKVDEIDWQNVNNISSRSYSCAFCGNLIASDKGWFGLGSNSNEQIATLHICHQCQMPTFFNRDDQYPNEVFGNKVSNIEDPLVEKLYEEARKCTAMNCYTASVMCCRKLLMHIAVSKGAQESENFAYYVNYLKTNNFVPPDAKWVDHIRLKGNEANHQILIMEEEDAKYLIAFIEVLLKMIYEFPALIKEN